MELTATGTSNCSDSCFLPSYVLNILLSLSFSGSHKNTPRVPLRNGCMENLSTWNRAGENAHDSVRKVILKANNI